MAGALKTLFGALQNSAYMSGVSLVYGEEDIAAQDFALPMVVMVPNGGPYDPNRQPAYIQGEDPTIEMAWAVTQNVDLYLWACSTSPTAQPIDHADAIETLRQLVLSAFQDQRVQFDSQGNTANGLAFTVVSERWEKMQNALNRFGRALVLSVTAELPVPMATPPFATVTSEVINKTLSPAGP